MIGLIGALVGGLVLFCTGWYIGWRRGSLHMALFIARNGGRLPDESRMRMPTLEEIREQRRQGRPPAPGTWRL